MIDAVELWEAIEARFGSEDVLRLDPLSGGARFTAFCPACDSRPERMLDIEVEGEAARLVPLCGCALDDVLIGLGLAEHA